LQELPHDVTRKRLHLDGLFLLKYSHLPKMLPIWTNSKQRSKDFLKFVKELREFSQRVQEERKAQDKRRVMDLIVEQMAELKRALLEAAGSN
jgi:hypothetical protein